MEFAFTHGRWLLTKFELWTDLFDKGFAQLSPTPPSDPLWKMVQECFNH
jgi:hypothetical protein